MTESEKKRIESMLRDWGRAHDVIAAAARDEREYRLKYGDRLLVIKGAGESIRRDSQLNEYRRGIVEAQNTAAEFAKITRKINDVLRVLPKREVNLIYALYRNGLTVRCAGELMGYSERQTYNIKAEMLEMVRRALRDNSKKRAVGDALDEAAESSEKK